ncbi:glycosyltransferase involved in cell wall biosynthesis [Paucimonas lemoignei]|uniref:Glycosyltransferase involved in cell wall biosynthesis n=1 Tax=Paucimonas lemoignei TaxID=29443 RepID=A0A4R3HQ57_PAULE|nr:glycosyltransferase family 4 protein [Paucimonas lemoignei]TCS34317.1 glycosyltransferase involved in cell wall biosynthesis [Paucimonas lemoignei]
MKIIILTSSLALGGTERVVASLCNEWAARGDDVTLILTYSGGAKLFYPLSERTELINLADVVGVKNLGVLTYAQRLYALRRLLVERDADVIVSFLPNVNVSTIISSAFLKTPLIICERSYPLVIPRFHILNVLRKRTYRYADMLTVQTDSIADKFRKHYPGLKAVRTIPNALPEEIATYKKSSMSERKILLSLGRLAPEKQLDKLLNTFSLIAPMFPDWDLHIYGDGPMKSSLDQQIRDAGLQSRAFLKGPTSKPWEVMAGADAFVMVSQYEGFPNALLEAMGIGLPCAVFDCPTGPREITRDGKDALLVPLNDYEGLRGALTTLMGNEQLRSDLGAQARDSVYGRFSHAQVMAQWDQLFKQVGAMR